MAWKDDRRRRGRLAETLVTWWLRARGWSVTARNRRVAGVEVDLLARRGSVEALIEVKSRRLRPGEVPPPAHELLSERQRLRLNRAAEERLRSRPGSVSVRVDLVVVLFGPGLPRLRHLEGITARSDVQP